MDVGRFATDPYAISHKPSAMSSYLLRYAHHLPHLRNRVDADDMCPIQYGGGHGGSRTPVALGRRRIVERYAHERFP